MKSHLTHQLLPSTFRNLVINDIVDTLGLPGRKLLDDTAIVGTLKRYVQAYQMGQPDLAQRVESELPARGLGLRDATVESLISSLAGGLAVGRSTQSRAAISPSELVDVYGLVPMAIVAVEASHTFSNDPIHRLSPNLADVESFLRWELNTAYDFLLRQDSMWLWDKYCTKELVDAIRLRRQYLSSDQARSRAAQGQFQEIYDNEQAKSILRERGGPSIRDFRNQFFADVDQHFPRAAFTTTTSLAWTILVNAALLNDRLIEDMQQVKQETEGFCPAPVEHWPRYYHPHPETEDCDAFNQYVRARWPVHVFALDPVTDEQNIAESFSQRREMQMALAAGVATGQISPNAASRYARRLETDLDLIRLNRKTVGFTHGRDTFGWRFYPRTQSRPVRGNLRNFVETNFGWGSGDQAILRSRKLEPGTRELTAIVLMPSFVTKLSVSSRSSWFSLLNPKLKQLNVEESIEIGSAWAAAMDSLSKVRECGVVRAEDIAMLNQTAEQLERRLPVQQATVSVPYENTLGGFELFNSGITDLAPALTGWYGAPGITTTESNVGCNCKDEEKCAAQGGLPYGGVNNYSQLNGTEGTCIGTTVYLVGKNFSVHDTRVIAGGRSVPFLLLSRRILQVTIPPNVTTLTESFNNGAGQRRAVDIHVATPYGVSNHLLVPTETQTHTEQPAVVTPAKQEPQPIAPTHTHDEIQFDWTRNHLKFMATIPEGEVVKNFKLIRYAGNEKLSLANKSEFPTPESGFAQAVVVVNGKVAGQTELYPLQRNRYSKLAVEPLPDHSLLEEAIEIAQKKLKVGQPIGNVEIIGFYQVSNWPPKRLLNPLTLQLVRQDELTVEQD